MSEPRPTGELKHTPLHALHVRLGGRMVPFAGYAMPVQYFFRHHQGAPSHACSRRPVRRLAHGADRAASPFRPYRGRGARRSKLCCRPTY